MAVTKLMHMKESPGWPHTHLKNSIDYILDVAHDGEKTDYGKLVGIARRMKTKEGRYYEELAGMLRKATRPVLENYACYSWTRTYQRIRPAITATFTSIMSGIISGRTSWGRG